MPTPNKTGHFTCIVVTVYGMCWKSRGIEHGHVSRIDSDTAPPLGMIPYPGNFTVENLFSLRSPEDVPYTDLTDARAQVLEGQSLHHVPYSQMWNLI